MSARLVHFGKFLKHGKRVASIVPSSRWLADALAHHVDPARPQVLVELGAGNGIVTETICKKMHPDSKLISVELDPEFHAIAQKRCPQATILNRSACELPEYLRDQRIDRVDQFINCLPTPSLPSPVNEKILEMFNTYAADDCWISQLTQIPWLYQSMYRRWFDVVDFRLVMLNFLPGGAYYCRKLRGDYRLHLPNAV